jgi:hypothetical protein
MGYLVLGGLFEAGTAVSLYAAPDGVIRANGEGLTGRRVADKDGTVGFDGLPVGGRFIARGFDPYGNPTEITCRALDSSEANEVAQPPVQPDVRQPVGTSEQRPPVPVLGEPGVILHVGVPAASAA